MGVSGIGQDLSHLAQLQILTSLAIMYGENLHDQDLICLSSLTSLSTLNISGCRGLGFGCLQWLKDFTSLTELQLSSNPWFGWKGLAYLHRNGVFSFLRLLSCSSSLMTWGSDEPDKDDESVYAILMDMIRGVIGRIRACPRLKLSRMETDYNEFGLIREAMHMGLKSVEDGGIGGGHRLELLGPVGIFRISCEQ